MVKNKIKFDFLVNGNLSIQTGPEFWEESWKHLYDFSKKMLFPLYMKKTFENELILKPSLFYYLIFVLLFTSF